MAKKAQAFKDFPGLPGESLMDRRIRFWKTRRASGGHTVMGKEPLKDGKPNNRQLYSIVQSLIERVEQLEKANTKEGVQC